MKFWITEKEVNNWFKEKNVFFILGMGRSGTKLLADLLNKEKKSAVFHEPVNEDFRAVVEAHKSETLADKYIKKFRKKRSYSLLKNKDIKTYGEVNSALRFHAKALKKNFPQSNLLHLVRNGKDVVRSLMSRGHYTKDGVGHHLLKPNKDDPLRKKWDNLNRFEKICWLWKDANERISREIDTFIKIEEISSDYNYFKKHVLSPINFNISKDVWRKSVKNPKNATKKYEIEHWTKWDISLLNSFNKICGKENEKYGYM